MYFIVQIYVNAAPTELYSFFACGYKNVAPMGLQTG
jgi:hypothetical protein